MKLVVKNANYVLSKHSVIKLLKRNVLHATLECTLIYWELKNVIDATDHVL